MNGAGSNKLMEIAMGLGIWDLCLCLMVDASRRYVGTWVINYLADG